LQSTAIQFKIIRQHAAQRLWCSLDRLREYSQALPDLDCDHALTGGDIVEVEGTGKDKAVDQSSENTFHLSSGVKFTNTLARPLTEGHERKGRLCSSIDIVQPTVGVEFSRIWTPLVGVPVHCPSRRCDDGASSGNDGVEKGGGSCGFAPDDGHVGPEAQALVDDGAQVGELVEVVFGEALVLPVIRVAQGRGDVAAESRLDLGIEDQEVDDPGQSGPNLFVTSSDHGQSVVDNLLRRQQIASHAIDHVLVVHVFLLLSMILGRHVLDCLMLDSLLHSTRHVASILDCLDGKSFEQPEGEKVHDDLEQVGIGAGVEQLEVAQRLVVLGRSERIKLCADAIFPNRVEAHLAEHAAQVDGRFVRVGGRG